MRAYQKVIVALISSDLRVNQTLPTLLSEVDQDLVLSRFASIEELVQSEKPETKEEASQREAAEKSSQDKASEEKKKTGAKSAQQLLDELDASLPDDEADSTTNEKRALRETLRYYQMVIIDLDQVSGEWAADHFAKLREEISLAETPSIRRPAIFVLSGQGHAGQFCYSEFNDLIMKPIDRQLFQQKAAHLLAGHGLRAEAQLYMASTDSMVEIGKDVRFISITELGFEILNPSPLKAGVQAFLHVELGETRREVKWMRFAVKAIASVPRGSEYAVQMMLEDPSADDVQQLRKIVRNNPSRTALHLPPTQGGGSNRAPARVGLICFDPHRRSEIQGLLRNQFRSLEIEVYRTYQDYVTAKTKSAVGALAAFQASLNSGGPAAGTVQSQEQSMATPETSTGASVAADPAATAPLIDGSITLVIDETKGEILSSAADGESPLVQLLNQRKITRYIDLAGGSASEMKELEQLWAARQAMGQASEGVFVRDGQGVHIKLSAPSAESKGSIKCELLPAGADLVREYRQPSTASGVAVDVLLVDDWQWPESQSVAPRDATSPQVVLIRDRQQAEKGLRFFTADVFNSLFWPLDRRWLGHVVITSAHLKGRHIALSESGLAPQRVDLAGRGVSTKPIRIDRVSEYGVRLVLPSALKPGSFLKVYSPLFELSERSGDEAIVIGLVAESTVTEDKPPKTLTFVKFFGASDALTKRIRSRIREQYAQEKERAQS